MIECRSQVPISSHAQLRLHAEVFAKRCCSFLGSLTQHLLDFSSSVHLFLCLSIAVVALYDMQSWSQYAPPENLVIHFRNGDNHFDSADRVTTCARDFMKRYRHQMRREEGGNYSGAVGVGPSLTARLVTIQHYGANVETGQVCIAPCIALIVFFSHSRFGGSGGTCPLSCLASG